jgi:hypothetical protein
VNRKEVAAVAVIAVSASTILLLSVLTYADNKMSKNKIDSQNKTLSSSPSFPTIELTTVKVNLWKGHEVENGEIAGPDTIQQQQLPGSSIVNESYNGLNSTQGLVMLNNQTFYMTTLDGNLKSIVFRKPDDTAVKFAAVTFTFARPPNIPLPTNPMIPVAVQFKDGTSENLMIQVQRDHPMTILTSHNSPRAGITITQGSNLMTGLADNQGKVKLLVSKS